MIMNNLMLVATFNEDTTDTTEVKYYSVLYQFVNIVSIFQIIISKLIISNIIVYTLPNTFYF